MKRFALMAVFVPLLIDPAFAKCKSWGPLCQPGTGCEPKCIVTHDVNPPYVDDRKRAEQRRMIQMHQRRMEHRRRVERGRTHTHDMASGGQVTSSGIVVSPFVPGTTEHRAWQLERKRRGLCGNDQRCHEAR